VCTTNDANCETALAGLPGLTYKSSAVCGRYPSRKLSAPSFDIAKGPSALSTSTFLRLSSHSLRCTDTSVCSRSASSATLICFRAFLVSVAPPPSANPTSPQIIPQSQRSLSHSLVELATPRHGQTLGSDTGFRA